MKCLKYQYAIICITSFFIAVEIAGNIYRIHNGYNNEMKPDQSPTRVKAIVQCYNLCSTNPQCKTFGYISDDILKPYMSGTCHQFDISPFEDNKENYSEKMILFQPFENYERENDRGESPVEEKTCGSNIPEGHDGLIIDLDFEKIDDSIVLDQSCFGNNGILYGGAKIFDSYSACHHALKLPRGADIVIDGSVMKKKPREAITIAVWIKLYKVNYVHPIFDTVGGHSTHTNGQFHFDVIRGDIRWFHRDESHKQIFSITTGNKMVQPMEWNHIAATYDANQGIASIFVNGTLAVSRKGYGLISEDWEQRVGIGKHSSDRFLNGEIDEFKMYDIVLDPREIAELATKCGHDKS